MKQTPQLSTNPVFPEFTPGYAGSPTDSQEEPIATAGARFLQAGCPSSYTTDNIKVLKEIVAV